MANITRPGAPDRDNFRVHPPKDHTNPQDFARFCTDLNAQLNRIAEKFKSAVPDTSEFITATDLPSLLNAILGDAIENQNPTTEVTNDVGDQTVEGGGNPDDGQAAVEEINPFSMLARLGARGWETSVRPIGASYGSATAIPVVTVDANGRVTSITTVPVAASFLNSLLAKAHGWTTSVRPTAGTYGSVTAIPVVTVDANGRVTAITTAAVASTETFRNSFLTMGG